MAKTTGGKKATGKADGADQKVTAAKSASSTRTTSSATSAPAGKKPRPALLRLRRRRQPEHGLPPDLIWPAAGGEAGKCEKRKGHDCRRGRNGSTYYSCTHGSTGCRPAAASRYSRYGELHDQKLNEVSVEDDANQSDEQPAAAAAPGKSKVRDRRAKRKGATEGSVRDEHAGYGRGARRAPRETARADQARQERGFLTYAEINDHLPDNFTETEALEGIIGTFNDMGVAVYEQAPDAETLLLNDNAPAASSDDEVEEEAEVALSTVDSEFGRTTDPVRMYMREMGTVELLTREGEIEIAKRIEDGLRHMVMAISACPTTIADILAMAERVANEEIRVDEPSTACSIRMLRTPPIPTASPRRKRKPSRTRTRKPKRKRKKRKRRKMTVPRRYRPTPPSSKPSSVRRSRSSRRSASGSTRCAAHSKRKATSRRPT